jgi:hypothetical protein
MKSELLATLKTRFDRTSHLHPALKWEYVQERLERYPEKIPALTEMERTGGEPDVIGRDKQTGEIIFCDCSPETPQGRLNCCYDRDALESRKANKPASNALDMAAAMGIEILTEADYSELQKLGEFDRKTSSWIHTPAEIRALGGALFCERRWNHVFTFHNGASSYFSSRGFRALLRV